jgi:predicted DNA-binding protein (UPF0251 family)
VDSIGFKWELNWELLDSADYEKFNAVKRMVILYSWLEKKAIAGDTVAAAIWIDIKNAIYSEPPLKGKQLEVVELVSQHYLTQEQVGLEMCISQQAVSRLLNRAVNTIMNKLNSGKMYGDYENGGSIITYTASDSPQDQSIEMEIINKYNCCMCYGVFDWSEIGNTAIGYEGDVVYRCRDCYAKWIAAGGNSVHRNTTAICDVAYYCPKCMVKLTTTKQCSMKCY